MADNTQINRGTDGDVIATDSIDDVKYQRVKMNFGDDGEASDVALRNAMPVQLLAEHSTLNAILVELEAINVHLSIITGA